MQAKLASHSPQPSPVAAGRGTGAGRDMGWRWGNLSGNVWPHQMRPAIDHLKELRRKLADRATFDQVFTDLRAAGASIFDCIVSVRSFYSCTIEEAKRLVESSPVWSDHQIVTDEFVREIPKTDEPSA